MPTNLSLDDNLIREAVELGGHKTKKDAVNAALDEYVRLRKRQQLLAEIEGAIDYDDDYDIVAERRRWRRQLAETDDDR